MDAKVKELLDGAMFQVTQAAQVMVNYETDACESIGGFMDEFRKLYGELVRAVLAYEAAERIAQNKN